MSNFADLHLSPPILKAIEEAGYTQPTPIQALAIPKILMGRDLIGLAQTGTGKTASFALPLLDILGSGQSKPLMPRGLILTPTRELAMQIAENFDTYGKHTKFKKALLIGGVGYAEQESNIKTADVLIATPGRLMDHFEKGKILLTAIQIFVIDEADRMLDMGFIPDIEKIASNLPSSRQTLLFSATMPDPIRKLAERFLSRPVEVRAAPPATTGKDIEQFMAKVPDNGQRRRDTLIEIIKHEKIRNAIVFCNRKKDIEALARFLERMRLDVGVLHGDMTQPKRMEMLDKFRNGKVQVLVASDVAARGLDVEGLSHVFNFEVPQSLDDYVHRIGRTGRAGEKGRAITLYAPAEYKMEQQLRRKFGDKLQEYPLKGAEKSAASLPEKKKEDAPPPSQPSSRKHTPHSPAREHKYHEKSEASKAAAVGFGDDVPAFFNPGAKN